MYKELPIDEIRPAKNPVRQTRDEEKIKELAQSIAEKGVLQPIKVRPVEFDGTTKYEIVFGARRWEAASLVRLETIPAIVEDLSDSNMIAEGLAENIQKEDMLDIDVSEGIWRYCLLNFVFLKTRNEWNDLRKKHKMIILECLRKILGLETPQIRKYMNMTIPERKPIVDEFYKTNPNVRDVKTKVEWLQEAMPNEGIEIQKAVARKVTEEGLGQRRVKDVAQAVANAETPELKSSILESSYEDIVSNPTFIKAKARQKQKQQRQKTKKQQGFDRVVKAYLVAIQTFNNAVEEAILAAEYDKFSSEAKQFIIRRHLIVNQNLKKLEDVLGGNNE